MISGKGPMPIAELFGARKLPPVLAYPFERRLQSRVDRG